MSIVNLPVAVAKVSPLLFEISAGIVALKLRTQVVEDD